MKIYPKGLYFDKPHANAPKFVKGKLSMKAQDFVNFLKENKQYINEKGYIKFDLLQSEKDGKLYFTLDTYKAGSNDFIGEPFESSKPKSDEESLEKTSEEFGGGKKVVYASEDINPSDIPF